MYFKVYTKWIVIVLILIISIFLYVKLFKSNTGTFVDKTYFYIKTGSTYKDVLEGLNKNSLLKNISAFDKIATTIGLPQHIHAGRYEIKQGMGNLAIAQLLKSGKQTPVKIVLKKMRTKADIISKLSSYVEPDSLLFAKLFSDEIYLRQFGLDTQTIQCAFMPNTYEVYWNTSAENVFKKIEKYKADYWTDERIDKAKKLGLTPNQVITLASIVDEETNKNDEKPTIASVYLNRLSKGMKLGADPTVKFAVGDFGLKRILNIHTQKVSPYNTYLIAGLPPGPICTPSKQSIEAVLNPSTTSYLFFCAKEDFSGYHNFATTYTEHEKNAQRFHNALNQRTISK